MNSELLKIVAILTVLIFFGCKKDKIQEEELPAITSVGANTFGTILEGRVYATERKCEYRVGPNIYRPPCAYISKYEFQYFNFKLDSKYEKFNNYQKAEIFIEAQMDSARSVITKINKYSRITLTSKLSSESYYLDTLQTNILLISNANSSFISGTFELHFINITGQKKELKNGRFDIAF